MPLANAPSEGFGALCTLTQRACTTTGRHMRDCQETRPTQWLTEPDSQSPQREPALFCGFPDLSGLAWGTPTPDPSVGKPSQRPRSVHSLLSLAPQGAEEGHRTGSPTDT
jgi:hypothetical protein